MVGSISYRGSFHLQTGQGWLSTLTAFLPLYYILYNDSYFQKHTIINK